MFGLPSLANIALALGKAALWVAGKISGEETKQLEIKTGLDIANVDAQVKLAGMARDVRIAMIDQPAIRWATGMVALTFATHIFFIGIGTIFAAPLGWSWLAWTLHIPPFPGAMADWEAVIVPGLFGIYKLAQVLRR